MAIMRKPDEIPWRRILVEGVAIVASILLAFAIDAWWQEHVENQRQREVLVALLDDFETSKGHIREWREFHLAVQESNTKLLKAAVSSDSLFTDHEIDRLLGDLGWWDIRSHITTGALNSVVFGGELSIIKDDALRQLIADWPSQIENLSSTQKQDYDFFLNVWMPFLRANGYLPQITIIDAPMPGHPEVRAAVIDIPLETTWSHSSMIKKDEFHNVLVQKWWIQYDILIAFDNIESLLDQTIQRIQHML
jgi:hypothetical protein